MSSILVRGRPEKQVKDTYKETNGKELAYVISEVGWASLESTRQAVWKDRLETEAYAEAVIHR